jgi:hypothetical protein
MRHEKWKQFLQTLPLGRAEVDLTLDKFESCFRKKIRVARWFVFKPKIPIWVKFRGPWRGKCCHILRPFGIFFCHLV